MKDINDLRETLFDTIQLVKSGKMKPDEAQVIANLGQVLVNTAKAEVAFIRETSSNGTGFISETQKKLDRPPAEYSNKGHVNSMKKLA
jgi:hypothetical protein